MVHILSNPRCNSWKKQRHATEINSLSGFWQGWAAASAKLGAWQRRNHDQEETLPLLSVEGFSTRANRALKGAFAAWLKRDLCQKEIVYLFVDDLYLGTRGQEPEKGRGPGSPQHQSPRQASGSSPKPGRWAHL